jgi:integrase/recombinase XerC
MMTRTVPYHAKVAKYLALCLKQRSPELKDDFLFHGKRGGHFVGEQLDRHFRKLLVRQPEPAKSFEFHRLRHSWATRLMNGGMEIAILKELGGWANWNSMQRYIRVLPDTIKRQYEESYLKLQEQEEAGIEESLSLLDFAALTQQVNSSLCESAG